jgi:hypothetical protein
MICPGDSVKFGTEFYSIAGIYTDNLLTINGCDSVSSLKLTVNPIYNDTILATICQGNSIRFGTEFYSIAGIYTDNLLTINGCDSVSSLKLTVNPIYNDTILATICQGDNVKFGIGFYSVPGIYTDNLLTINGCDSVSSLKLTVNPIYQIHLTDSIFASDDYNENGFSLPVQSNIGVFTHTLNLQTINGCDSTVTLKLTVLPAFDVELMELPEICGDYEKIIINYNILFGRINNYSVIFNEKAINAGFSNIYGKSTTAQKLIEIPMPDGIRPDRYLVKIVFVKDDYSDTISVELSVLYPASVITQKWNDVLALYNENYNGGYIYSEIEWYRNGKVIWGEIGSYLYINNGMLDPYSEYRALLTRIDDGVKTFTCPFVPVIKTEFISVRPTLVHPNGEVIVILPNGAHVTLWNTMGLMLNEYNLNAGETTLRMPAQPGVYLLNINDIHGNSSQNKIVVE